jgi:pilus assembly protein Flp/PilA
MHSLRRLVCQFKLWRDSAGQDLIEYALMAGFVAVAAGAIMPGVANSISQIFSQVASVLSNANGS